MGENILSCYKLKIKLDKIRLDEKEGEPFNTKNSEFSDFDISMTKKQYWTVSGKSYIIEIFELAQAN